MTKRQLFVTSALPYANGIIHLGHILEQIQTDIFVQFQRLIGNECYYLCACDAHGAAIMLSAEKDNLLPQDLIDKTYHDHLSDFKRFGIYHDIYHTTHSEENLTLVHDIYHKLKSAGKFKEEKITQLYDVQKNMFLADRFVKGKCPKCHAHDQYGDNCEKCGSTYLATELIEPYSVISGTQPILKESIHLFFKLSECQNFLKEWCSVDKLQTESFNKINEWLNSDLTDWDVSRDVPYFGFEIPDYENKYFYVWFDAPIGYLAAIKKFCESKSIDFYTALNSFELHHFIGKDILYFHALFWPAILKYSDYPLPDKIVSHGFLTINGEKMSKSRGNFISAKQYLNTNVSPDFLRYYFASKLGNHIQDIDFNVDDFVHKVNTDLVNKYINIAARCAKFLENGCLVEVGNSTLLNKITIQADEIKSLYHQNEYSKAIRLIMFLVDEVNEYIEQRKPWILSKENDPSLAMVCSEIINAFWLITGYLSPVLPETSRKVANFLNVEQVQFQNGCLGNRVIKEYKHLLNRIDVENFKKYLFES